MIEHTVVQIFREVGFVHQPSAKELCGVLYLSLADPKFDCLPGAKKVV